MNQLDVQIRISSTNSCLMWPKSGIPLYAIAMIISVSFVSVFWDTLDLIIIFGVYMCTSFALLTHIQLSNNHIKSLNRKWKKLKPQTCNRGTDGYHWSSLLMPYVLASTTECWESNRGQVRLQSET